MIAPPLGIMPKLFWLERRYVDVRDAIMRYEESTYDAPTEWYIELYWLAQEIQAEKVRMRGTNG